MGAHIEIKGNLGGDPVFGKTRDGRPWINFSVYQPHWVKNPDAVPNGPDQYIDKGGFWLQVSWFNNKAESAAQLLKKGTAVVVSGDLHVDTWTDKDTGELKAGYKVTAHEVTLDLRGITGVSYRQRSQGGPQPQPNIGKRDAGDGAGQNIAGAASAPAAAGDGGWDEREEGDYWSDNTPPEGVVPPVGTAQPPANNGNIPPQDDGHDDGSPF
ncbi:single-stranded DNA-binding protein [uncultured Cardiobacterium sp.]|jgi:single-stranded DNA-binding protein|uniref:single-stranded DNA-binding protein n=1 Tax=uncultured Cardiobacterium sp. TaxID=417619 RepID=UPI002601EF8F|nr:single-stranded DNA-binding protein [uncultured Cardiobacterium sp.]